MRNIFLLAIALMTYSVAYASDDIYTVREVKVDAKAGSAVEAEQKAMTQARVTAFHMLVERLVPEEERAGLADLSSEKIEDFVDSFEVNSQKNSKVRYIATMTFYFDGNAVQNYLGSRTQTVVTSAKQPIVIVPVFIDQGGIILWGEQNPWLDAWSKREKFSSVTPIVVPMGDLKDLSTVDGKQIIAGEVSGLHELARRYGGSGVLIAIMRRDSANPMSSMSYETTLVTLDGAVEPLIQTRIATEQGSPQIQFDQAIAQIVKQLENQARIDVKVEQNNFENQLLAKIPLDHQNSWQTIQQSLKGCSEIKSLVVKGLARKQATIVLTYRGSTASLDSALNARGLQLEQLDGQTWVIRTTTPKTSTPY